MDTFIKDLSSSQLCTNPQDDLDKLVDMYNSTLEEVLDNHAPIQTKQVSVQQQTKWYNMDIAFAKKGKTKGEEKVALYQASNTLQNLKSEIHKVKRLCKKAKSEISTRKRFMIVPMTRKKIQNHRRTNACSKIGWSSNSQ